MKKKLVYLCMLSLFVVFAFAACRNNKEEEEYNPNYDSSTYLSGFYYAQIDVEGYGSILLALDADSAPATVTNFVNLAEQGFYDGLTFHRVVDGFMIQGGDPFGDGTGGSYDNVPGEFAANGHTNPISHVRGVISMARLEEDNDSASSQFFIVQEDATQLDGYYAAFGIVIDGMEIVDAICVGTPVEDENGTVLAENQPVISSITILTEADFASTAKPEAPSAIIDFFASEAAEGITLFDSLTVTESGKSYLLFTSGELTNLSIYATDLATGMTYDEEAPLASCDNVPANGYLSVKITATVGLPTHILVAKEPNGAVGKYLIFQDSEDGEAYLVPVSN